jgi:site-specific recombinase XerD
MLPESSTVRSILVRQDIQALTRQCCQAPTGIRNRALIVILYRAGLRLCEALTLAPTELTSSSTRSPSWDDTPGCFLLTMEPRGKSFAG